MKLAYYCNGLHTIIDETSHKMAMSELLQCFALDLAHKNDPHLAIDSIEDKWAFLLERGFLTDKYYVITDEVAALMKCREEIKDRNAEDYKKSLQYFFDECVTETFTHKQTSEWIQVNALPKGKLLIVTWDPVEKAEETNAGGDLDNSLVGAGHHEGDFKWIACTNDETTSAYVSKQIVDMRKYIKAAERCKATLKY
jgi:hypothetical protein